MARLDQPSNVCKCCSIELPIGMFYEVKGRHGVKYADNTCKKCRFAKVQAAKAQALLNAEEADRRRKWRLTHKRKVRRRQGCRSRAQMRATSAAKNARYIKRQQHRAWLATDQNAHVKRWRQVISARLRQRIRLATPQGRVENRMRVAIGKALRGGKSGREWESLVGYSLHELVEHLQKQFTTGMEWSNIGKWHIDHIVPRKLFNYKTATAEDDEFKACWSLTNLQPLWAADNIRKSDHVLTLV